MRNIRVADAVQLSVEFDELMVSIPADETADYLRQAIHDPELRIAFYAKDLLGNLAANLQKIADAKRSSIEIGKNCLVYSEAIAQEPFTLDLIEQAVSNTSRYTITQLLGALPPVDRGIKTAGEDYQDNALNFINLWYTTAKNINPERRKIAGTRKPSNFLPEDVAADLLVQVGIIPPDYSEAARTILSNSIPENDRDSKKDIHTPDWRYDLYPASRDGIPGYILRRFNRGIG